MHIKTVNTDSKYKCIVMRGNDPGRVDRGEGYRAVNRLNCCDVLLGADGVIGNVEMSELGGLFPFFKLPFGTLLTLVLAVILFG